MYSFFGYSTLFAPLPSFYTSTLTSLYLRFPLQPSWLLPPSLSPPPPSATPFEPHAFCNTHISFLSFAEEETPISHLHQSSHPSSTPSYRISISRSSSPASLSRLFTMASTRWSQNEKYDVTWPAIRSDSMHSLPVVGPAHPSSRVFPRTATPFCGTALARRTATPSSPDTSCTCTARVLWKRSDDCTPLRPGRDFFRDVVPSITRTSRSPYSTRGRSFSCSRLSVCYFEGRDSFGHREVDHEGGQMIRRRVALFVKGSRGRKIFWEFWIRQCFQRNSASCGGNSTSLNRKREEGWKLWKKFFESLKEYFQSFRT